MSEKYYEVILPDNAGRAIVIQEFSGGIIGVGYLHFGEDVMEEVRRLGGYEEGAHYGIGLHDQYCSIAQGSWLFPIEHKEAVIALTHRVIGEIEEEIEVQKKRGRPAQDKKTMAFTLDNDLARKIMELGVGQRSAVVNDKLRGAFGLPQKGNEEKIRNMETLENYLKSSDFKAGVIAATRASWGGSGYSVELFPDGTWQNLWNNQIGNLYESKGIILHLPTLDTDDMGKCVDGGAGSEDDYLSEGFANEEDELAGELRESLKEVTNVSMG